MKNKAFKRISAIIILLSFALPSYAIEKAIFPMDCLNISQGVYEEFSHKGRLALDICGEDTGKDEFYAPFTGTVMKKYGSDNVVWLESTEPVEFADGTVDYMTIMCMHDDNTGDLWVGKTIKQGDTFLTEGMAGTATGNHIHLECAKGKFTGTGWYQNQYGKWCINNGINPWDALYLSDTTIIKDDYGYDWKVISVPNAPTNPKISVSKSVFTPGEKATFVVSADDADGFTIGIDKDGARIHTSGTNGTFSITLSEAGNYSAYVTAYNKLGFSDSERVYFRVPSSGAALSYRTVTYNPNGGSNPPPAETLAYPDGTNEYITIPLNTPIREGYTFRGWSDSSGNATPNYFPGDRYYPGNNITLYAIWESHLPLEGSCGSTTKWKFDKAAKTLTISGTGRMYDYSAQSAPWNGHIENIETIVIESGITGTGKEAFKGLSKLKKVIIPASVTTISENTFKQCPNISTEYDGTSAEFYKIDIKSGNDVLYSNLTFRYLTVTFMGYGKEHSIQRVKRNEKVTAPSSPMHPSENYTFSHWTLNGSKFDLQTKITDNLVIYPASKIVKYYGSQDIILTIGDKEAKVFGLKKLNDVVPVIRNGRTMLPARFVAESLGAIVEWLPEEKMTRITKADTVLCFYTNSNSYGFYHSENGKVIESGGVFEGKTFIENNRVYVPVRILSECLGAEVKWNEKTRQVIITPRN